MLFIFLMIILHLYKNQWINCVLRPKRRNKSLRIENKAEFKKGRCARVSEDGTGNEML
jgi:hypothetical protein